MKYRMLCQSDGFIFFIYFLKTSFYFNLTMCTDLVLKISVHSFAYILHPPLADNKRTVRTKLWITSDRHTTRFNVFCQIIVYNGYVER